MNDFAALIAGLDGLSTIIGLFAGFICAMLVVRLNRRSVLNHVSEQLSDEVKNTFENVTETINTSVKNSSSEALKNSQEHFISVAADKFAGQRQLHSAELDSKKNLIETQLQSMSKTMSETLNTVPENLDKNQNKVTEVLDKTTKELKESNQNYLNQLKEKAETQTEKQIAELEEKKKLIDQHLAVMKSTLEKVPTQLESNQNKVSETLEKSSKNLEESSKRHLTDLQQRSEAQTEKHSERLDSREKQINERLTAMDDKLGKVQTLIDEFEKARERKLGALDDQLKNLTQTTSSLQKALADNRARGQWGERMAEEILSLMGMIDGVHYHKQLTTIEGKRPDFTFPLPNQLSLNMDCKFPVDNYLKYVEADNDKERAVYSRDFLRNIETHVTDITKRDYINAQTVDCVLIFIPNEQIYRFINEQDNSVIDTALKHKVILCSPITLYVVLAVIRQAARNFTIEQRSREIVAVVNEIRKEWEAKSKYTHEWEKLQGHLNNAQSTLLSLTTTRTNVLDRKFAKIEGLLESSEMQENDEAEMLQLPETAP